MAGRRPQRGGLWYDTRAILGWLDGRTRIVGEALGSWARRRYRMRLYDTPDALRGEYEAACMKVLLANPDAPLTYAKVARVLGCSERLLRGRLAEHGLDRPAEVERGIRASWGQRGLR